MWGGDLKWVAGDRVDDAGSQLDGHLDGALEVLDRSVTHMPVRASHTTRGRDELREQQSLISQQATEVLDGRRGVVRIQRRAIPRDQLDRLEAQLGNPPNTVIVRGVPLDRPDRCA